MGIVWRAKKMLVVRSYVIFGKITIIMSRIGKQYISIPEKVTVKIEGPKVSVDGPKGKLSRILPSFICCTLDDNKLSLEKTEDNKLSQSLYGLSRTLVANMVTGVSTGFHKKTRDYRGRVSSSIRWKRFSA